MWGIQENHRRPANIQRNQQDGQHISFWVSTPTPATRWTAHENYLSCKTGTCNATGVSVPGPKCIPEFSVGFCFRLLCATVPQSCGFFCETYTLPSVKVYQARTKCQEFMSRKVVQKHMGKVCGFMKGWPFSKNSGISSV